MEDKKDEGEEEKKDEPEVDKTDENDNNSGIGYDSLKPIIITTADEKPKSTGSLDWLMRKTVASTTKIEHDSLTLLAQVKPTDMIGVNTLWRIAIDA